MDARGRGGTRGFMRGRGSMRGAPLNSGGGNEGGPRGRGGGRGLSSRRGGTQRGITMSSRGSAPVRGRGGPGSRGGAGGQRGGTMRGRPRGSGGQRGSAVPQGGGYQGERGFQDNESYLVRGLQSGSYPNDENFQTTAGYQTVGSYDSGGTCLVQETPYDRMPPQGSGAPAKRGRWDASYQAPHAEEQSRSSEEYNYSMENHPAPDRYYHDEPFYMGANGGHYGITTGSSSSSDHQTSFPVDDYNGSGLDRRDEYQAQGFSSDPVAILAGTYDKPSNFSLGMMDAYDSHNYDTYDGYYSCPPQEIPQRFDVGMDQTEQDQASSSGPRSGGDDHYGYETYREPPSYGGQSHEGHDDTFPGYGPAPHSGGGPPPPRY